MLIERSLGPAASYAVTSSREGAVAAAAALGVRTPRQAVVATLDAARQAAASFGYPVVLKREQTCGGFGVAIVPDDDTLARAFGQAARKAMTKRVLQTLLRVGTAGQDALVLQSYVAGPMAFRVVACAAGKVLDGISFQADCIHPPVTGASTVLSPLDRPDMEAAARILVAALGCTGLVSLDFVLSAEGACLIELNPRPVTSGHLGRLYGHDIYAALVDHVRGASGGAAAGLEPGTCEDRPVPARTRPRPVEPAARPAFQRPARRSLGGCRLAPDLRSLAGAAPPRRCRKPPAAPAG